jgi:3-oxoacyl-[acyl-carrier-protein] synthase II
VDTDRNEYLDRLETLSRKQLMVLLARAQQERTQPIAITGMGCRLPGQIDGPEALWTALHEGRPGSGTRSGPPTDSRGRPRWNTAAPDLVALGPMQAAGAYLDDVDLFDAEYFDLDPEQVTHIDPQQRLLLEVTVRALADANLSRAQLRRQTVGVYVGATASEYNFAGLRNGAGPEELSPAMATGTTPSGAAARIGLALGVEGPALTLDTACSTALSAVHCAAGALRSGECDVALVGVSHLILSPVGSHILELAGLISPTGRSRPFTADADGSLRAEGCGVIVLERHRQAVEAGRTAYALIRGSAVHHNGDRPTMASASGSGMRTVIDLALNRSGVAPHQVQYVEAQANGSRIAGIVEAEILSEAYHRGEPDAPALYLGSSKAVLGYLETASAVVSLMKTALALQHAVIPPQPGADNPDPAIAWPRSGLTLPAGPQPWPTSTRRLAAVNAVGFTGIAAHVVLEGAPGVDPSDQSNQSGRPVLLILSAHSRAALAATAERLLAHLKQHPGWSYASVCRTLAEGRDQLNCRQAAVVTDAESLIAELSRFAVNADIDVESDSTATDLDLLARQFRAGTTIDPSLATPAPQPQLCRLPGPVLLGTSYWTDANVWR